MKLPIIPVTRVRVTISVDIDTEAWIANYGVAPGEVRSDVKTYVEGTVIEQLRHVGVLAEGES